MAVPTKLSFIKFASLKLFSVLSDKIGTKAVPRADDCADKSVSKFFKWVVCIINAITGRSQTESYVLTRICVWRLMHEKMEKNIICCWLLMLNVPIWSSIEFNFNKQYIIPSLNHENFEMIKHYQKYVR